MTLTARGIYHPERGAPDRPSVYLAAMAESIDAAVQAASPTGEVKAYAGATAPSGYLLCQGQAVSRATYPTLFAVIGTAYGAGDGGSTFNVPNLRGRVLVGADPSQTEFATLGKTGGAKTHRLTVNEMPSHSHGITKKASGPATDATNPQVGGVDFSNVFVNAQTAGSGADVAHNNLQPYLAVNYIIKF